MAIKPNFSQEQTQINGMVERITFHSETTGFSVLKVKIKRQRDLITVVGAIPQISVGESINAQGEWVFSQDHGRQFKAKTIHANAPNTVAGMQKYLGSGMIKGFGPHFAKTLINAFGEETFQVIENNSARLLELPGIGQKRHDQLTRAWEEQKFIKEIMVFLHSHGVGSAKSTRIYKTYGDQAIDILKENPYRLSKDIFGIGFKTADEFAKSIGIPGDSLIRAEAGLEYMLAEFSTQGSCAVSEYDLIYKTQELLNVEHALIQAAIQQAINNESIKLQPINDKKYYYKNSLYRAEVDTANDVHRLSQGKSRWCDIQINQAIQTVETSLGYQLSCSQKAALEQVLPAKFSVITGGPGVGKTTLLRSVIKILQTHKVLFKLCAPTGRAAKRLAESTGLEAKTIHRTLEFDISTFRFKHNQFNPLEVELLVVDEISMVDIQLMSQLLRALPSHAAVLLVGDVDQLPSVGPGSVLADIIKSNAVTTVALTEIFRQAADSQIIVNAHKINQGKFPHINKENNTLSDFYFIEEDDVDNMLCKLITVVSQRIPNRFKFDPVKQIQVLTPMNRGKVGTHCLNQALQEKLNPKQTKTITRFSIKYSKGDKVLQTRNNYDKDVYNGDIGFIQDIDLEAGSVLVDFLGHIVNYEFNELDELVLAYAMSIHKSQGSEYPAVVIPLATQHYMLLERNLLYTAITRGKKLVVIIGQKKALYMAIKRVQSSSRITYLTERIQELFELTV